MWVCWMNRCALFIVFLPWGEGVAWGRPLSVALHEVPPKGQRITLSFQGAEGQVTVGASHFPGSGTASGEEGKLHWINRMPNPWSANQASIIIHFLSGKYDLLFKDLIYGLVFRSTLRQEAVHPIPPILFQALNNNSESFHSLFPNEISYSLCPTPNPAPYSIT